MQTMVRSAHPIMTISVCRTISCHLFSSSIGLWCNIDGTYIKIIIGNRLSFSCQRSSQFSLDANITFALLTFSVSLSNVWVEQWSMVRLVFFKYIFYTPLWFRWRKHTKQKWDARSELRRPLQMWVFVRLVYSFLIYGLCSIGSGFGFFSASWQSKT